MTTTIEPPRRDELWPIGTAARLLGVTVPTVRNWERSGKIVCTRTPTGQRRVAQSEIDRLLNMHSVVTAGWDPGAS
jgi:excisionase family DNA binding protein